jgi:signal transduction histidine kinase/CheY-like chemotaxis protein
MTALLTWLFSSDGFMPHGHCYLWQPGTLWLNVGSDGLIAAAYFSIPVTLNYFVRRRRSDIPFPTLFLMFAAFIFLCGSTHVMEIWTVWHPDYRLAGALKLLTAVVSVLTALVLYRIVPLAMQLRSPDELQREVESRTAELASVNVRLQQEIAAGERAQAQLRELDRRKDEYLATLAHELRNPLAPMRSAARILIAPGLTPPQLKWAQAVIERQISHMAQLLDDLLDVQRITRGKLELKKEVIALNTVVQSAIETAQPLIDAKGHTLTVEIPSENFGVEADPLRLAQIVSNLLTNAAKYTDHGGRILLSAAAEDGTLRISVQDNGIGIPQQDQNAIFEMFTQVDATTDRAEGGLGIGLAFVQGLAALHGGEITVRSDGRGRGSEFIVRLPGAVRQIAVPVNSVPDALAPASAARRILITDDNQDAATSLAMLLEIDGHQVQVAFDGPAALNIAASFQPQVALLDIGMPDMDGYALAQRLRQMPGGEKVYLVAVTGWGQQGDRERSKAAGFNEHLTKPVDPEALTVLLTNLQSK